MQGQYIGPASGVSFLLRIQKRLRQAISISKASSIFTFGDAPLQVPESDPSFCMMLPRADAQRLVDRYFEFAMPTYRFLHRPTLQSYFDEFYDTLGIMEDTQNASAKIALLFMVFAQARVYMPDNDRPGPPDLRPPDAVSGLGRIESECRRRTFWCAYTLDAYLSAALGRPRTFHDNDIDSELPACIEDEDLTNEDTNNFLNQSRGSSTMLAAIAHMNLYSVKPVPASDRASAVEQISKDLHQWRSELSRFLDVDIYSTSFLISIFQRQRNVLNLTYWHAIILTHRPFVLRTLARLSQNGRDNAIQEGAQTGKNLKECIDAAMNTVNTISEITESRQLFRAFWVCQQWRAFLTARLIKVQITAYFAFNATIMLYIHVIQQCTSPSEFYAKYFSAASRCQSHIAAIAEKGSLSERYCLVLEELRVEALRQIKHAHSNDMLASSIDDQRAENPFQCQFNSTEQSSTASFDLAELAIDLDGNIPALTFPNYSGWEQFTSLLSSGLGNMDGFISYDQ
ncbi:hypothetical protein N7481_006806 [Penicillium waksmanii]|uniref:uncharacterized protein n=1 Tax=Penicillium waksmanii TaxID=69791 RepID=UPI002547B82C|nr:uncharacterized protein N7481_006806 [Penicillium waksmanii]KAJ5984707.1 hypothetical protein N7481_006806 [Penicillium waksmanii]